MSGISTLFNPQCVCVGGGAEYDRLGYVSGEHV